MTIALLALALGAVGPTLEIPTELAKKGLRVEGAVLSNGGRQAIVEVIVAHTGGYQKIALDPPLAPGGKATLLLPEADRLTLDAVVYADRTHLGPDRGGRIAEAELQRRALDVAIRDLGKAMSSEDAVVAFFTPVAARKDTPFDREMAKMAEFILGGLADFDASEILAGLLETRKEFESKFAVRRAR